MLTALDLRFVAGLVVAAPVFLLAVFLFMGGASLIVLTGAMLFGAVLRS